MTPMGHLHKHAGDAHLLETFLKQLSYVFEHMERFFDYYFTENPILLLAVLVLVIELVYNRFQYISQCIWFLLNGHSDLSVFPYFFILFFQIIDKFI